MKSYHKEKCRSMTAQLLDTIQLEMLGERLFSEGPNFLIEREFNEKRGFF